MAVLGYFKLQLVTVRVAAFRRGPRLQVLVEVRTATGSASGIMCLHFSYPASDSIRTRARRFLRRCVPTSSQVCFEPLTRTSRRNGGT
jgi:hypothetical protein